MYEDEIISMAPPSGGTPPTFRILTEDSDNLAAEDNNILRTE